MWCAGYAVFRKPNDKQFVTCKLKDMGSPICMGDMSTTLTHKFLHYAVFGSFATCPSKPLSIGCANYTLGEWKKYMDITPNILQVQSPVTWDVDEAVKMTQDMLEKIYEGGYSYMDKGTMEYQKHFASKEKVL